MNNDEPQKCVARNALPLKAIILSGGPGTARCPVVDAYPSLLFPMLDGQPLLKHMLDQLADNGIRDVAVSMSGHGGRNDRLVDTLQRVAPAGVRVQWQIDEGNRGAGGAIKELEWFLADGPAVVLHPSVWLGRIDLQGLLKRHAASGASVTMVLESTPRGRRDLENVVLDEDGVVRQYSCLHVSRDNRRRLHPAGIYIIEPIVTSAIEPERFVDLNEQVLGWLNEDGYKVIGHVLRNPLERFFDASHYLHLNRSLMLEHWRGLAWRGDERVGVITGDGAQIADDVTLIGPVVLGPRCKVASGAVVIGPVLLGEDVEVGPGALVRDSVIWRHSRVESRAAVEYSMLTERCTVSAGERIINSIVQDGGATVSPVSGSLDGSGPGGLDLGVGDEPRVARAAARATYEFVKRAVDIAAPILALPLLAPILLLTALAVKLDSPGPVIFRQVRCGKNGREFKIFKFRTMVQNADELYAKFLAQNQVKGPMFKMKKDPRTTRTGEFLRRTSLDELPQLWNVLRGEMSLVGPRPLAMREMVWCPRWRDQRLTVKPGMTGLWQVSSRGEFDFDGWIEHDISYVKKRSLWVDFVILLRTVKVILHRPNAA